MGGGAGELNLSQSLTSLQRSCGISSLLFTAPTIFYTIPHSRLDPTALHCTSEWVGELSESVSSPETETGGIAGQIKPDTASGKDQFSFNPFTQPSQTTQP